MSESYAEYLCRTKGADAEREYRECAEAEAERDGTDEFGYCDECGEPLMFARMSTCARCAWSHER